MSPNRNFTKTEISAELKCHQKSNVTKIKCHQNLNVPKTKMLQEPNLIKTRRSALIALALFIIILPTGQIQPLQRILPTPCSLERTHGKMANPPSFFYSSNFMFFCLGSFWLTAALLFYILHEELVLPLQKYY